MLLAGEENIREVIAFPKNNKASDPMTQAPSPVSVAQLEELSLQVEAHERLIFTNSFAIMSAGLLIILRFCGL